MKKNVIKKMVKSTAIIFAIASVTVPNMNVFAVVDSPTINTPPAAKLDNPTANASVTVKKDIVLFNVAENSNILSPNISYSYEITSAAVTNATITTFSSDDLEADGKTPKQDAVPITVAVKQGVIGAVSTSADNSSTKNKVEGTIRFGAADDATNNNTTTHPSNKESSTTVNLSKKVSSSMTISLNANKIYDPDYGNVGHTNTQVNGPGVYRYKIEDVTSAATLAASGIERKYKTAENDHDNYIYLDVYTKYNSNKDGLVVYGYVLLKDTTGNDGVSVNYDYTKTNETLKITGFDTDSENTDVYGDGTVAKASLTSDSYHTYNVEVSKKTDGDLADTQHNFPFKVELTNDTVTSQDDFYYVITKDGTPLQTVNTNLSNTGAWTLNGATASTNLQLQNGDKILITGLPVSTKIKVTETNDTKDKYTVSAKGTNGNTLSLNNSDNPVSVDSNGTAAMDDTVNVNNTSANDKIEFTNALKDISVTGLLFSIAPFVFITAAGAVLLGLLIRNKKNSGKKSKI